MKFLSFLLLAGIAVIGSHMAYPTLYGGIWQTVKPDLKEIFGMPLISILLAVFIRHIWDDMLHR